jgi:hypothetical protein
MSARYMLQFVRHDEAVLATQGILAFHRDIPKRQSVQIACDAERLDGYCTATRVDIS